MIAVAAITLAVRMGLSRKPRSGAILALAAITAAAPGAFAQTYPSKPVRVIQTLNAEVNKILQAAETRKFFDGQGMAPTGGTAAQFNERIRSDHARWVKLVKETGIKIN